MRFVRSKNGHGRRMWASAARGGGKIVFAGLLSITALSLPARAAAALVNLPQSNRIVAPAAADSRRLTKYFTPPYRPGPLPPEVDEMLLRSAPPELGRACAAMVDSWGAEARGSSRVSVRIMAVAGGNAWVAYRCDSRVPQYAGLYSERLATFSAQRGAIQFIDLGTPDDSRATLYHVALSNTVKLLGAESSAAFQVFAVNAAPGASGAKQGGDAENRYVIVASSAAATRVALSLVTRRVRPGANDRAVTGNAGGDHEVQSQAGLRFGHDLAGHLTGVNVYHRDRSTGLESHYGFTHYEWNRASLTFEVAEPVTLPPVPPSHQTRRRPLPN